MRVRKIVIAVSFLINIVLIPYLYLKINHYTGVTFNSTSELQRDLVQLEGTIDYQIRNDWNHPDSVIEKIEDVRESIGEVMNTGKGMGLLKASQEDDLWSLHTYFINYPTFNLTRETTIDNDGIGELIELREQLRAVGWRMNTGYGSDWDSFSEKVNALVKAE